MDLLLTMTIFRDEFNIRFVTLLTTLLFAKIFHWLVQDRVNYVQYPFPLLSFTSLSLFLISFILLVFHTFFVKL
jgi:E3 ubiquitin-protein ligase synoviolin